MQSTGIIVRSQETSDSGIMMLSADDLLPILRHPTFAELLAKRGDGI